MISVDDFRLGAPSSAGDPQRLLLEDDPLLREKHRRPGTLTEHAVQHELAAMQLHERGGERKPEPCPRPSPAVGIDDLIEGLEDLLELTRLPAHPVIAHLDPDAATQADLHADADPAATGP